MRMISDICILLQSRKIYFDSYLLTAIIYSLTRGLGWVIDSFKEKDSGTLINDPH